MSERVGGPHDTLTVKAGDTLAIAALTVWLHAHAPELLGSSTQPLHASRFDGGFSNRTYRIDGAAAPMVLRRPPRGVAGGVAHDMSREYRLLTALHPAGVRVPRPLVFCDDHAVLGAPFYLMELVDGVILRGTPPANVRFDTHVAAQLSRTFVHQLAALHSLNVNALGLGDLGRPDGYVMRQLLGWSKRWQAAQTSEVPNIEAVAKWLADNAPGEHGASLIHNDFKYDNLVLDPDNLTQVRAILDWEMATVGCPLMDLGTSLAYWVEANDPPLLRSLGLGATALPGSYTRQQVVDAYSEASTLVIANPVFYYAFGVFKLAVVAQQIFARHVAGLTSDPRFAQLDQAVAVLGTCAARAIERDSIGG